MLRWMGAPGDRQEVGGGSQDPDEPLGVAVALGFPHESRRAFEAEEADLALEMVAHVIEVPPRGRGIG